MLYRFMLSDPLSLDNALTNTQIIHKLITHMNEVVDYVNNLNITANQYTDEQISRLNDLLTNYIDTSIKNVNQTITELEKTLKKYTNKKDKEAREYFDYKIRLLEEKLTNDIKKLRNDMNRLLDELRDYVDLKDSEIYKKIDDVYNELLDLIKNTPIAVYSPVDGMLKNINDTLYDMINVHQQMYGITWDIIYRNCQPDFGAENRVTYDSIISAATEAQSFNNWNALAFFTSQFLLTCFRDVTGNMKIAWIDSFDVNNSNTNNKVRFYTTN